ncbi:MAG TPA: chemotaxis protein CheX [Candidatus Solibacter sp.]|nr:chemotaxis protein CheX [Candidatus Solibacter sp.]
MFFINAVEEPLEAPESSCSHIAVKLAFEGDPPGSLTLRTTRAVGRSIAADFLGDDAAALSERQVEEIVCELANMICGAVLSRVESRAVFRLGSPQVLPADDPATALSGRAADAGTAPAGTTVRLAEFGGGGLTVTMHMEGPACTVVEKFAF